MLGVLGVHSTLFLELPPVIGRLFVFGKEGVMMFFVLSGYLACTSIYRTNRMLHYYRNRVLRILPIFYAAIIIAIVYREFILDDMPNDEYHLYWIRYFSGLNFFIPTREHEWFNLYGWWAMSYFIIFYFIAPFFLKYVRCFKHAVVLFIICTILKFPFYVESGNIFTVTLNRVFLFMWYFCMGIAAYWAIQDKKTLSFNIISTCLLVFFFCLLWTYGVVYSLFADAFVSIATAMLIVQCSNIDNTSKIKASKSIIFTKVIPFVSKYSFHVYLCHGIAFAISKQLTIELLKTHYFAICKNSIAYSLIWILFSVLGVLLFSWMMHITDKSIKMLLSASNKEAN